MADEKNSKIENKIEQFEEKKELEQKHGMRKQNNSLHPSSSALIGATLISFGMGLQSNSLIGIYCIGLALSLVDLPKLLAGHNSKLSKLLKSNTLYFAAGGLAASMLFHSLGYPVPNPDLGLLAGAAAAVTKMVIGIL